MVKRIILITKILLIAFLAFLIFKNPKILKLSFSIQNFTINLFPIYQTIFLVSPEDSKIKNTLQGSHQAQKRSSKLHHGEDILQTSP